MNFLKAFLSLIFVLCCWASFITISSFITNLSINCYSLSRTLSLSTFLSTSPSLSVEHYRLDKDKLRADHPRNLPVSDGNIVPRFDFVCIPKLSYFLLSLFYLLFHFIYLSRIFCCLFVFHYTSLIFCYFLILIDALHFSRKYLFYFLGFFEYDRKVLRYYGIWDTSSQLFGDSLRVRLHYYLADNTMEGNVLYVHTLIYAINLKI